MFKVYNIQSDITSGFHKFIKNSVPNIRKTQLNFLPSLMFGMISSESCASSDIAKSLKDEQKWAQFDSVVKRINRFFNNKLFDGKIFFNNIISSIIDSYKTKHSNKRVHITFDHMFSHDNYAVFMFTMRIGTQGFPIYFDCFKGGKSNSDPFKIDVLKKGIKAVHDLFKDKGFDLVFLADRWFCSTELLDFIDSLGHTYCVRLKGNIHVYKDSSKFVAKKLKHHKHHAIVHKDVLITDKRFKTNIVYSNSLDTSTPWIIVTNKNIENAILNYSYRFGSIYGKLNIMRSKKRKSFNLLDFSLNLLLIIFLIPYMLVFI